MDVFLEDTVQYCRLVRALSARDNRSPHTRYYGPRNNRSLALPVRMGGLGLIDPARASIKEYEFSVSVTGPLVRQIVEQVHQMPDASEI